MLPTLRHSPRWLLSRPSVRQHSRDDGNSRGAAFGARRRPPLPLPGLAHGAQREGSGENGAKNIRHPQPRLHARSDTSQGPAEHWVWCDVSSCGIWYFSIGSAEYWVWCDVSSGGISHFSRTSGMLSLMWCELNGPSRDKWREWMKWAFDIHTVRVYVLT